MKKKKHAITLIEIMIVILLIGIVGGTLAFNMRGSMDQGRAFKSEQNSLRIQDILLLEAAQTGRELAQVVAEWESVVARSPMTKDPTELCRDGWRQKFTVTAAGDEVQVTSEKLRAFKRKHEKKG